MPAIAVVLIGLGACTTEARQPSPTSWVRTESLALEPRVDHIEDGPMDWTLTAQRDAGGRICWTARITAGPSDLRGIDDLGDYCSETLGESTPIVQFPFVQQADRSFSDADGFQTIAGVVDDRLERVRINATDGQVVEDTVADDGTFVARLPLDFRIHDATFEGDDLEVVCLGGSVEDLDEGQCTRHPKE